MGRMANQSALAKATGSSAFTSGANPGKAITDAPSSANITKAERDLNIWGPLTVGRRRSRYRLGIDRQQTRRCRVPQRPAIFRGPSGDRPAVPVKLHQGMRGRAQGRSSDREALGLSFLCRLGIDLGDLAKAVGFGIVRTRDKCSADLGRVPAGYHAEPKRLFCLDVSRGEILHFRAFGWAVRFDIERRGEGFQLFEANICVVQFSPESRVKSASTLATRSRWCVSAAARPAAYKFKT